MLPRLSSAARLRPARLAIGPGADFVGVGTSLIDLRTRGSLRRIVVALVELRTRSPGTSLSQELVFEAGWPDERVSPRAAAARVYTAMYTLRRMGLRGILVRRDDGYLIDPRVEVDTASPWEAAPSSSDMSA